MVLLPAGLLVRVGLATVAACAAASATRSAVLKASVVTLCSILAQQWTQATVRAEQCAFFALLLVALALETWSQPTPDMLIIMLAPLAGPLVDGGWDWKASEGDAHPSGPAVSMRTSATQVQPTRAAEAHENHFGARQFRDTYPAFMGFLAAGDLVLIGVATGNGTPEAWMRAFLGMFPLTVAMGIRAWLHMLKDHQRAHILCGRVLVLLSVVVYGTIYLVMKDPPADRAPQLVATYVFLRILYFWLEVHFGFSAILLEHRLMHVAISLLAHATFFPTTSELGRPAEAVIDCVAILAGFLLGQVVEQRLRAPHLQDIHSETASNRRRLTYEASSFEAAFAPLAGFAIGLICLICGFAAGERTSASRRLIMVVVPTVVVGLLVLVWLHSLRDQEQARQLFGQIAVALSALSALGMVLDGSSIDGGGLETTFTFVAMRLLALVFEIFLGYAAVSSRHRFLQASIRVGSHAFLRPACSELGRPMEPIITFATELIGVVVGNTIDDARRRLFDAHEEYLRRRLEAEAQAKLLLQQEAEQDAAKEAARIQLEAQAELAAYVFHELRNDMHAVTGILDSILEQRSTARGKAAAKSEGSAVLTLDVAHLHALHGSSVVTNMLEYTKLRAGKLVLPTTIPFQIRELGERCLALTRHMIASKPVELHLECPDVPLALLGSPFHLQQVLLNLLTNAIKYTDVGSVTLSIVEEPMSDAPMEQHGPRTLLRFEVADTVS